MAKSEIHGIVGMKKVFKNNSDTFILLKAKAFDNEKTLQTLIEKNLGTVFDGLEFLTTELQTNDLRPDSVAYDNEKNCFVVIEYKNVKNDSVLDQGATYYRLLQEHKGDFVLLYNHLKNQQRKIADFNWDEPYIIFLSPVFTKYQVGASGIGLPIQLYQVLQYDDGIITLERMGDISKHTRFEVSEKETKSKIYVSLDEYDEEDYLSGKYKTGNASKDTRKLYIEIKKMILEKFKDLESRQKKVYVGFYSKANDACVCTLDVGKTKIKLTYSITASKNIRSSSKFIRDVEKIGIFGVGHYQSEIKNTEDMKLALLHIQKVYDYKIRN